MLLYEKSLATGGNLQKPGYAENTFHLRNEIIKTQTKDVHGHLAGIKIHTERLGRLEKFGQCRDIALSCEADVINRGAAPNRFNLDIGRFEKPAGEEVERLLARAPFP